MGPIGPRAFFLQTPVSVACFSYYFPETVGDPVGEPLLRLPLEEDYLSDKFIWGDFSITNSPPPPQRG